MASTIQMESFAKTLNTLMTRQNAVSRLQKLGIAFSIVALLGLGIIIILLQMTTLDSVPREPGQLMSDADVIARIHAANVLSAVCADTPGPQTVEQIDACVREWTEKLLREQD